MIYALDTNTISDWIKRNRHVAEHVSSVIKQGGTLIIPPVAYYELRRGFKYKAAPGKEFAFVLICNSYKIGEMTLAIWESAADIYSKSRKSGKPIGDADILIAAFCITNNYTLVTHNTRHFEHIEGLRLEDWTV